MREKSVCECSHFITCINFCTNQYDYERNNFSWWFIELENTILLQNNDGNCVSQYWIFVSLYMHMHLCEHALTANKIRRFMCLGPVWGFLQMFSKNW